MTSAAARSVGHPAILALAGVVLAAIVILSFLPTTLVSSGKWNLGHAPAYAALVICLVFALARSRRTPTAVAGIGLMASLVGGAIELAQPLVGRSTSLLDFSYNVLGVAAALAVFVTYARVTRHAGWGRA